MKFDILYFFSNNLLGPNHQNSAPSQMSYDFQPK